MNKIYNWKDFIQKTLEQLKINEPTKIQKEAIPPIINNKNIIGVAPTGTGKTLAFLLPILQNLDPELNLIQAVIIVPTRELGNQIKNVLDKFIKNNNTIKVRSFVGGAEFDKQIINIKNNPPHILISTPKRFNEALNHKVNWNLTSTKYLVYDEIDMLIDQGFINDLINAQEYLSNANNKLVITAFSATLHEDLINKIKRFIKNATPINVSGSIWVHENIKHYLIKNKSLDKLDSLHAIIKNIDPYLCLIFVNKISDIDEIKNWFEVQKIPYAVLHGKLDSRQRKQQFNLIKNQVVKYGIVSDLSSRGMDFQGVSHVISWNLPKDDIWYIHRSGRTSRSIYQGESYVLHDPNDEPIIKRLEQKKIIFIPLKINRDLSLTRYELIKTANKKTLDDKTAQEIKKILNKAPKKVQPGYKKKVKQQINKVKAKAKREAIEKKVKERLIAGYKRKNTKKN
ncbi:DEAD/DEAH box helicase [Mycoplasma bradburyae]|uniref:DEAD/DEAH box helicase n=1 Tax=Mycoplasma bradburyae TaxID=2963128 RepID=UPI002341ACAD|nr:DEAD/DEAH box helicase [Mycoplasma bradburyae]MDC4182814.1 DEAD/DEAH box helicase [Mycoplasma bradburyae]